MNKTKKEVKLVPLGGSGTVTNNMYIYETDQDIMIVDCGIGFPDDAVPGIDLTIPDISYLEDKKDKIKGIVLTHAHLDHTGGLPYILPQLGTNIPVYASRLTLGFLKEKFKEFHLSTDNLRLVNDRQQIRIGDFEFRMIPVTHSVPDTKHLFIKSPAGNIYHGGDFKFDWTPVGQELSDIQAITKAGAEGINLLLSDCLGSEKDGYSHSESTIQDSFEREIREVEGKAVITTMSSNISRIQQALDVAKRNGRKVAFIGYSIEQNVRVAQSLGFLNIPKGTVVHKRKTHSLPDNKTCLIVAGSQGQMNSSLTRIAAGEHEFKLKRGDKVIYSADPIPGNEKNVYRVIDMLSESGIEVSYSDISDDLHVSGHASSRELMMLLAMTKPKNVLPIGGTHRHVVQYSELAKKMGIKEKNLILSESNALHIKPSGQITKGEKISLKKVFVEGGEIDVPEDRIRDRKLMFQEGAFVVLINISSDKQSVNFDLIPKGIIKDIDPKAVGKIKNQLSKLLSPTELKKDRLYLKDKVAKAANSLLIQELELNPLIIPVVIEE